MTDAELEAWFAEAMRSEFITMMGAQLAAKRILYALLESGKLEAVRQAMAGWPALAGCDGVLSGPNGMGGMKVVANFPTPGDELALFGFLTDTLPPIPSDGEEA